MYSLHELYKVEQNSDSLRYWREQMLQQYPNSRYAQMIKSGGDPIADSGKVKLRQQYQQIDSLEDPQKPMKLRRLALANRSTEMAPYIFYRAIERYIDRARYSDSLMTAIAANDTADIAPTILSDTTAMSTIDHQQFNGAHWDSVRMALQQFDTTFTDASQRPRVNELKAFLEQKKPQSSIQTCNELGISLSVDPSMDQFLATISYPDRLKSSSLSGEVVYSFVVNSDGTVVSYQLESNRTSLGIEDAFEQAFDEKLKFMPLEGDNVPSKIRCTVRFPIKNN